MKGVESAGSPRIFAKKKCQLQKVSSGQKSFEASVHNIIFPIWKRMSSVFVCF